MKIKLSLLLFLISASSLFCQGRTYVFDSFTAKIENAELQVFNKANALVFSKKFNDPKDFLSDLDGDGVNEYLIIDISKQGGRNFFTLYVFNTIDSFYVADSVQSGYLEPYLANSEEVGGVIIISGNPNFDSLNTSGEDAFIPLKCWKYDNCELFPVSDEVYNVFISENDTLIEIIDSYFSEHEGDCNSTYKMKGIISAVYANYLSAGDKILAAQFLKTYYRCQDIENFKLEINKLL